MSVLTLNLLTTTIVAPPSNGSKWQMGFNSAFKGLKHLKTLQHVSIIIQIIFRGLVGSLLKSLNLKVFISFFKLWRLFVVMRQHNVRCVCVATYSPQMLYCRITTNNLHNFKKTYKNF